MSFKSFKKDLEKRKERQDVINALAMSIRKLEAKRDEYAEKAKNELKKGNSSQYSAYVALLKNAMFNLSQAKDMQANYTIACDLLEMQNLNQKFVKSINSVMKDVYKTSTNINVASSQKIFNKALFKQNYTSMELQRLLKDNNMSFASSVSTISDISDDEVRKILESEIRKDEGNIDDTIAKLEQQYSVAEKQERVAISQAQPSGRKSAPEVSFPDFNTVGNGPHKYDAPVTDNGYSPSEPSGHEKKIDDRALNVLGNAYRPQSFDDYLGQPNAVATIKAHIVQAKLTGKTLPHVLMCGSSGMGKTTFARIIAKEMGGNFYEITKKEKLNNVVRVLKNLKKGDIVFIDEIHGMAADIVETVLYPAMEDFEIHVTDSNSVKTNCKTVKIAPFTLIGATTSSGKLLRPFFNRFGINIILKDYSDEIIATIIKNSFRLNEAKISDELCFKITARCQGLPRLANNHVRGIFALALAETAQRKNIDSAGALDDKQKLRELNVEITEKNIDEYFKINGIDENGLREQDRELLEILIDKYNGGPAGLESLAKAMRVEIDVIDKDCEPYLVKLGLINIRPQGRYATDFAYKYMGREAKLPKKAKEDFAVDDKKFVIPKDVVKDNKSDIPKHEGKNSIPDAPDDGDDDLTECECKVGEFDAAFAEKFITLFSGEGKAVEQSLDELFPDINKDYESTAKNRYILKTGKRELYCDSKLERRFLSYIFGKGFATDAKTEGLELTYSSRQMSGKHYYPDFILKLYDGTVAVVEMKNLSSVGNHLNIDKYEALKEFCTQNGYRYAEIAKDHVINRYVSAEDIKRGPINDALYGYILDKVKENGVCTTADLDEFIYDARDLACILMNDRNLKNIDRTGNMPQIVNADD